MKLLMAAACLSLPIVSNAQTESPRGIYKMMTLTGKQGEIKAPFDQYKICTDSVTLMLNVQGIQASNLRTRTTRVPSSTTATPSTSL